MPDDKIELSTPYLVHIIFGGASQNIWNILSSQEHVIILKS